jgi:hypothetical protein
MSHQAPVARGRRNDPTTAEKGWAGLISFAAMMLLLIGSMHALGGVVALFQEEQYQIGSTDLVVSVDYTAWGVLHLALGILLICAGYALFYRRTWARIVTIVVALISAIVNFAFIPAFPVWYTLMVGLDVLIIWAVTAHPFAGNPQLQ